MTVREMLSKMSSFELSEWMAFLAYRAEKEEEAIKKAREGHR